jgi:hypothetical protein
LLLLQQRQCDATLTFNEIRKTGTISKVIKYLENQNKLKEQFTSVIKYVQNEQECKKQNHSILFWRIV